MHKLENNNKKHM